MARFWAVFNFRSFRAFATAASKRTKFRKRTQSCLRRIPALVATIHSPFATKACIRMLVGATNNLSSQQTNKQTNQFTVASSALRLLVCFSDCFSANHESSQRKAPPKCSLKAFFGQLLLPLLLLLLLLALLILQCDCICIYLDSSTDAWLVFACAFVYNTLDNTRLQITANKRRQSSDFSCFRRAFVLTTQAQIAATLLIAAFLLLRNNNSNNNKQANKHSQRQLTFFLNETSFCLFLFCFFVESLFASTKHSFILSLFCFFLLAFEFAFVSFSVFECCSVCQSVSQSVSRQQRKKRSSSIVFIRGHI